MKEQVRFLISFYINSSIHVALAVTALSIITAIDLGFYPDPYLSLFIFFGAITGYNFIKYSGIAKLHHPNLAQNLKIIVIFSLLSAIAALFFAFYMNIPVLAWTAFFGLLTLLYAVPVHKERRSLRTIGGIKVYVIAVIWAGVSVLLPVVQERLIIGPDVIMIFLQRFVLVLFLLLPFEIRDLRYDASELKTLPQKLGVKRTKILGYFLLLLFVLAEFMKKNTADAASIWTVILFGGAAALLLKKTREIQPRYFASFWIEGLPVTWLFLLLIFKGFIFGSLPFFA